MKKIISVFLITVLCSAFLFSCVKNPYACEEIYGVIKYSEESERLIVYIPKYGDVEIPESDSTYASFNGPEKVNTPYTLKEGDLVKISFVYVKAHDDAGVCVMETYPAKFDRKADTIEAVRENFDVEKSEDGYFVSLCQDNASEFSVGDEVSLTQCYVDNGKTIYYTFGVAIITEISGNKITANISILDFDENFLEKFRIAQFEANLLNKIQNQ